MATNTARRCGLGVVTILAAARIGSARVLALLTLEGE